ncbi:MAG: hypothetical protein ABI968_15485 [Acidobacteriota bacterium]
MKSWLALALVITLPAVAEAQTLVTPNSEQIRRHEQISLLEGTLVGAVRFAAGRVAKEVQSRTNNTNFFAGEARAKGFTLDGYGVFVYIEIPTLDLTVTLMVDQMEREAQRKLDTQVANRLDSAAAKDLPNAKDVPGAKETLRDIQDTGEKYRGAVKLALTDAMLDFSKNLELKPDEWLSVAARGSESALTPGEVLQLTTVVLRVKGSDLTDYLAGRLTKEQAREKVEVRQF